MNNWERVRLGEVMKLDIDAVEVNPTEQYKFAGVYSFGRGLFERENLDGGETSYKFFHKLHANTLVVSKVKGWEGAIGLVSEKFENCFLSPIYPTFRAVPSKADVRFIHWYLLQESVWKEMLKLSSGMGARRNSISEERFLSLEIPLPPLAEQARIVARLESLQRRVAEVRSLREEQARLMAGLVAGKFREITAEAPLRRMGDVAPLVRRPVDVKDDETYPELGVRSFGKGTFHKPEVAGFEVGTKQLYHIHPGDLVFSNVFAWEGAIAVVKPEDAGRVGSHRFITCLADEAVVSAEFLCYHFLTTEGLKQVQEASPGGAGRNRTLGLTKLVALKVPIPPLDAQREFAALLQKAEALRQASAESEALLAGLLPGVLAGVFGEEGSRI